MEDPFGESSFSVASFNLTQRLLDLIDMPGQLTMPFLWPLPTSVDITPPAAPAPAKPIATTTLVRNSFCDFKLPIRGILDGTPAYVDSLNSHAGNAKRFKAAPGPNEAALSISAQLLDTDRNVLDACEGCKSYFRDVNYYRNNPESVDKVIQIKSNTHTRVSGGNVTIRAKVMCSIEHHRSDNPQGFVRVRVRDASSGAVVTTSELPCEIRTWVKGRAKRKSVDMV
eukprot:TRINITY_DN13893_c0_g1_i1.p1 TRINITY_DN13893_c0_g1~~TRINITY_DN13893_c0_g1_i1.p1  ORF type:complete len:240 (+),score=23.25 TRINITY_DN13893_c0_g1_i1:44-721(+)